jgi:GAF domain-containing protein
MTALSTSQATIVGLLSIGGTPDIKALFTLIVQEAPRLVGATECSIFWKNGAWREDRREKPGSPDDFYRRATYAKKQHLIGVEYYQPGEGLTGWVIKRGKTLRIDDITKKEELRSIDPDLRWMDKTGGFRDSEDKDRQCAFLAVPVSIDDEIVGVIRIAKTAEPFGTFTQEGQALLEAFAKHVATIITRVEDDRQKTLWDNLYVSGISLNRSEFDQYLQRVADQIPNNLGAEACSIFLTDHSSVDVRLLLRATTTGGLLMNDVGHAFYEFGEGLTGWVAKCRKTLRLRNVDDKEELKSYDTDLVHLGKHEEYVRKNYSYLAAPIQRDERTFGVIRIAQNSEGRFFSSSDQRLLEYFCQQLAVLVQNTFLVEQMLKEKEDLIRRLRNNRAKLVELGREIREDLAKIGRSLKHLSPEEETGNLVNFGPIAIKKKRRERTNVFVGFPYSPFYHNVYEYAIRPALEHHKLKPLVPSGQGSSTQIFQKVVEYIHRAHLAIIDISEWNPNVLFELGILYAQDHPVILLAREDDARLPADLGGMDYIRYGSFGLLKDELVRQVGAVMVDDLDDASERALARAQSDVGPNPTSRVSKKV